MKSEIIDLARKLRRDSRIRALIAAPRRWLVATRQRLTPGVFSIEIEATCGFFAVMQLVLFVLKHCEERSLIPQISARGGLYGEPSRRIDWFAQLFEVTLHPQTQAARRSYPSRVRSIADLGFRTRYEQQLTLPMANELFSKYLRVQPSVMDEVDVLCSDLSVDERTLGVHYRGNDKAAEARRVSRQEVLDAVRMALVAQPGIRNILVASDEVEFIAFFRQQDFGLPVMTAPASHLAQDGKPVHFSRHPGLAIGREALETCLLLSRCGFLVKTASYLSAWAKVLNPALRVWVLADAHFFPDHALWLAQQGERGPAWVKTTADRLPV